MGRSWLRQCTQIFSSGKLVTFWESDVESAERVETGELKEEPLGEVAWP